MNTENVSLGEYLRQERERKGLSIEQVASATKIGVRSLHSLEANHFSELPAKPFIRGFVISYCRFIGLEPGEVLASYEAYIEQKSLERPNRGGGHSGYAFDKKDGEQQSRTLLFFAIFGFVIVGALAVLFLKPTFSHRRSSHIDKLKLAHTQAPASTLTVGAALGETLNLPASVPLIGDSITPAHASQDSSNEVEEAESEKENDELAETEKPAGPVGMDPADPLDSGRGLPLAETQHKVAFKIMEDTWVRYQVDDRPTRKFIIRAGRVLLLKGREKLTFQAALPDAVQYSYNGSPYVKVGESSGVQMRQNEATLFFPASLAAQVSVPFKESRPLPKKVEPKTQETNSSKPFPN